MFSGLTENLNFHASPESFIASKAIQHHRSNPDDVAKRTPLRAKILNRNVVIVSAYRQVRKVLDTEDGREDDEQKPPYVAMESYSQLMKDFFPPPNLLLRDGCPHARMRRGWAGSEQAFSSFDEQKMATLTARFLEELARGDGTFDLYDRLKDLSWQLFLSAFLELEPGDTEYADFVRAQEDLLRGQFSLFPVSVNTGVWHSPRKTGIDSRKKLQKMILMRLDQQKPDWLPDEIFATRSREEIVNHLLMSTSSLAVKGFASLLTAYLLNVFTSPPGKGRSHASIKSDEARKAILTETMRLSPPIVGVMRRTTSDRTLPSTSDDTPDVLIPAGWDVWTYFPGANRDPSVFDQPDLFRPDRFVSQANNTARLDPIIFGTGPKRCLGATFVENVALIVARVIDSSGLTLEADVQAFGVRGRRRLLHQRRHNFAKFLQVG